MKERKTKILLVDDSAVMRAITVKLLESAGHKIDTVDNGRDGITKVEEGGYDLVLLDIKMKGMDGFQVFQHLRAQEKTKLLPEIIFYSDYEKMEAEGLQYGASDFITKSHAREQPKEFIARIEAHLKIAGLTRACIELEKLRTLKATVMAVDHEVRNPLVSIGLILDKMKNCNQCAPWHERGKESAKRIADALDRLSSVETSATTDFKGQEFIDTAEAPKPDIHK